MNATMGFLSNAATYRPSTYTINKKNKHAANSSHGLLNCPVSAKPATMPNAQCHGDKAEGQIKHGLKQCCHDLPALLGSLLKRKETKTFTYAPDSLSGVHTSPLALDSSTACTANLVAMCPCFVRAICGSNPGSW